MGPSGQDGVVHIPHWEVPIMNQFGQVHEQILPCRPCFTAERAGRENVG